MIENHPAYKYSTGVLDGSIKAPHYVILQCSRFKQIADGKNEKYFIDEKKVKIIGNILKLLIMPKGLSARKPIYNCVAGFQWLFLIAVLCTVYRDNPEHRRYETVILEICRKNGKTFLIGLLMVILFRLEPQFSKFYSVAPDGSLSREVKTAITEIINSSPALNSSRFKIRRDDILCQKTQNDYIPLNYSTSRLDGKLPNVALIDEVGALPSPYAIEAMRSGQVTILNKLCCIISTKYPKFDNPFEDEIKHAKKVLDNLSDDETCFALLYEPDDTKNWMTNDEILEQANPLSLEVPEIMVDLKKKRSLAIETESKRENFVCKHCNIIYQGVGTSSYINVADVMKCKVNKIDWTGKNVYVGVDFAESIDNCAVGMTALDDDKETILADAYTWIPSDKIELKSITERINYDEFIRAKKCFPCGDSVVDYSVLNKFVLDIETEFKCHVIQVGYDRRNALPSAQIWKAGGLTPVEVRQHTDTLHPAIKLLREHILNKKFAYKENRLLEINFQNCKLTENSQLNMYINKKNCDGKIDMIMALIDSIYLLNINELLDNHTAPPIQVF